MLQYYTNPNLLFIFFYLLRFSRSDRRKFFSPVSGQIKLKHAPKNEKFGKFSEKCPQKFEHA